MGFLSAAKEYTEDASDYMQFIQNPTGHAVSDGNSAANEAVERGIDYAQYGTGMQEKLNDDFDEKTTVDRKNLMKTASEINKGLFGTENSKGAFDDMSSALKKLSERLKNKTPAQVENYKENVND